MNRLSRRVALWGGAAAIAAGGFAFMASNTVASSSAGEGEGSVTGYKVTAISYTVTTHYYGGTTGGGTADLSSVSDAAYTGVSFTLTSTATTTAANGQPTFVMAYAEKATGGGHYTFGHAGTCTPTTAWTSTPGSPGTGTYSCTFAPLIPAATLGKLNVEANQ